MGNTGPSHRLVYMLHIVQFICRTKADTMWSQELRYIIKKSRETVHQYDNVSERAGISFRALKCEVSTSHHFRRSSGIRCRAISPNSSEVLLLLLPLFSIHSPPTPLLVSSWSLQGLASHTHLPSPNSIVVASSERWPIPQPTHSLFPH